METSSDDNSHLKAKLVELQQKWENVCTLSVQKQDRLKSAMTEAETFHQAVHSMLEWLAEAEQSLRFHGPLPDDGEIITEHLENHKDFTKLMAAEEARLKETIGMGMAILKKCHPDAETVIKHWITVLEARWAEVENWSDQREKRLLDALAMLKDNAELLEVLLAWLEGAEQTLQTMDEDEIPEELEVVEKLLEEHQEFQAELTTKQEDVDRLIKPHKRRRSIDSASAIPIADRSRRARMHRGKPRSREPSPGPDASKNPRVALLFNKWKHVWVMALDRQRKLQDAYDRLSQMVAMRNFNFEEWRKRYMRWMNNKKSRVMDFFRRIDLDHDGKVTRREFIEGILSSKFPTNRLEMNAVADRFDRDGDGYIDYKEFIAALKPDSERAKPETDGDKIQDEVRRQVSLCTCTKQFQVLQIGEGKYRFGESQRLRLVRILRSTVMVRVGGGWMALDEFLVKNDPCRARGRTNIELRERFILAEGVSQSMQAFRGRSPGVSTSGSSTTGSSRSMSGPIMKIREKKNITRPWQRTGATSPATVTTSSDGATTTRKERRPDGTVVTKTHTTHECPGGPDHHHTPVAHPGEDVTCKAGGKKTRTFADVKMKTAGGVTRGEVTFQTETMQTRTVTLPTVARTTYTRVPKKTSPPKTTTATETKMAATPAKKTTPRTTPSPSKPPGGLKKTTSRESLSSDKGLSVFDRLSQPRKGLSRSSSRESVGSEKDGSAPFRRTASGVMRKTPSRSSSRESLTSDKDTPTGRRTGIQARRIPTKDASTKRSPGATKIPVSASKGSKIPMLSPTKDTQPKTKPAKDSVKETPETPSPKPDTPTEPESPNHNGPGLQQNGDTSPPKVPSPDKVSGEGQE